MLLGHSAIDRNMANSKSKKIPDRWERYTKMGKVIEGTTIMPIKVPLREGLTSSLPSEERFPPSALLELVEENDLKLGGVVDLTFTTKYYDPQFFTNHDVGYQKVFTAGHVIPNDKTFMQFASAIKTLEKEGTVICVHCTHGLNRSGYMICRYMIEVLNIEPQTAIRLFEQARGHKMERQNYIDDLMRRTPGAMPDVPHVKSHGMPGNSSMHWNNHHTSYSSRQDYWAADGSHGWGNGGFDPSYQRGQQYRYGNYQKPWHSNGEVDGGTATDGQLARNKKPNSHIVFDDDCVPVPSNNKIDHSSRSNGNTDTARWNDDNTCNPGSHRRNRAAGWKERRQHNHNGGNHWENGNYRDSGYQYQCDGGNGGGWGNRHWQDSNSDSYQGRYNSGGRGQAHYSYSRGGRSNQGAYHYQYDDSRTGGGADTSSWRK